MSTLIRLATEDDLPALAELYVEFHNFHAEGVPSDLALVGPPDQELYTGIEEILQNEKAAVFVAEDGGTLVGFVEIHRKQTDPNPAVVTRTYALLQSLMVTQRMRRHGLGARLVEAAHAWAREQGATEIELETWEFPAGPLRFYEGLGYRTVKRRLAIPV